MNRANRKAAQEELCKRLGSPDAMNLESIDRMSSLARRCGLADTYKAVLLRRAGNLDAAIEAYQQFLAETHELPCSDKIFKTTSSGAPFFLGSLWLDAPEEAIEQSTFFASYPHVELAELYRQKGDFVHAIAESRTALQVAPDNERARMDLIGALEDSGDLGAAVAESKEASRAWPDRYYLQYLLGHLLVKKNDPDAAIVELQGALKKTKNHLAPANCELGRAFEQKGDLGEAYRQYRTAFRARVNDPQCRADYERLKLQLKK
jgi:tetratricopeptide (TPR) repeat protein